MKNIFVSLRASMILSRILFVLTNKFHILALYYRFVKQDKATCNILRPSTPADDFSSLINCQ